MSADKMPEKLSLVLFSGSFDKLHYALAMASSAVAINRPATLFFTMSATRALRAGEGWHNLPAEDGRSGAEKDAEYRDRGIGGFDELLQACSTLGVRFIVCEMGLRAEGLTAADLRDDLPLEVAGLVTLLNDASRDGSVIFI
ncbi:hypothetical protein GH722_07110 [Alphaproteobacteria bacterium HT1-32]|nr:hypothetical protein [Alphaproteobacteria bacterium HT1-32]